MPQAAKIIPSVTRSLGPTRGNSTMFDKFAKIMIMATRGRKASPVAMGE